MGVINGRARILRSLLTLIAAGVWNASSLILLDKTGLTKKLCEMELLDSDRKWYPLCAEAGFGGDIAFLLQMDAPESLDSFVSWMKAQLTQHPEFTSRIVQVGYDYYLKQVTDEKLLADQFRIIEQPMDREEAEQFISNEMSKELPRHDTRLKMTFIRQKTDPAKIFVFAHTDHAVADGLGLIQTFANLQDNREGNCVPCPIKKELSWSQV